MSSFEILNVYLLLFADSLTSSLILPVKKHTIFEIMIFFQNHNYYIMLLVATLGSIIGSMLNWMIGRLIIKMHCKYYHDLKTTKPKDTVKVIMIFFLVILSWIDILGPTISLISGYKQIKILHVVSAVFTSFLAYYLQAIFLLT